MASIDWASRWKSLRERQGKAVYPGMGAAGMYHMKEVDGHMLSDSPMHVDHDSGERFDPIDKTGGIMLNNLLKVAEDVSKEELREELKKHEERETPEQEKAESKHEQEVERKAGVEKHAFWDSFKVARKLSYEAREELPKGDFVFPKERRYPIHDENHARNALARVAQHGTPAEKAAVKAAVHRKYPHIGEE